jgi:LysM repeat protein
MLTGNQAILNLPGLLDTLRRPIPSPLTRSPYSQPPASGYDAGAYSGNPAAGAYAGGSGRTHMVVRGDTLTGISRRYSVGVSDIMRANNLNNDLIREGQKLTIP